MQYTTADEKAQAFSQNFGMAEALPDRGGRLRQSDGREGEKTLKKSGIPAKFLLTWGWFSIMMYWHAAEGKLCAARPR